VDVRTERLVRAGALVIGVLALGLAAACGSGDDEDEVPAEEATARAAAASAAEADSSVDRPGRGEPSRNGSDDGGNDGAGVGNGDGRTDPGAPQTGLGDIPSSDEIDDPGGGADEGPVETSGNGFLFVVQSPETASGPFTATVEIAEEITDYRAFNIEIRYDPAILQLTSADYAGVLGPDDGVVCPSLVQNEIGKALLACTILGDKSVRNTGAAVHFRFETVAPGTSVLNITTVQQGGSTYGAYVIDRNQESIVAGTRGTEIRITQ
jgi:hypothetical protein